MREGEHITNWAVLEFFLKLCGIFVVGSLSPWSFYHQVSIVPLGPCSMVLKYRVPEKQQFYPGYRSSKFTSKIAFYFQSLEKFVFFLLWLELWLHEALSLLENKTPRLDFQDLLLINKSQDLEFTKYFVSKQSLGIQDFFHAMDSRKWIYF